MPDFEYAHGESQYSSTLLDRPLRTQGARMIDQTFLPWCEMHASFAQSGNISYLWRVSFLHKGI
jgi:hypothetical protein